MNLSISRRLALIVTSALLGIAILVAALMVSERTMALINTSVERVEQGTSPVDQAGATMSEVVSAIRRATDIMGEISAASTERSSGVAQVGDAVTQMDQAMQQNAALVEQSAAAAESLKSQAQQLVQTVAVFKLAQDANPDTPSAAAIANLRSPIPLTTTTS